MTGPTPDAPEDVPAPRATAAVASVPRRGAFGWLRRMYDWTLSWAQSPWGPAALFVLAFVESSFFPIPPDPLLIALCLGAVTRSMQFALLCTVASVLGGVGGYMIGWGAFEAVGKPILAVYGKLDAFGELAERFRAEGGLAVLLAAVTPIPYKLVTISAGVVGIDLPTFIGASLVGRGARYGALAALIAWKGEAISGFIEERFEMLTVVFAILLVGGFVAVRLFL